MAWSALGELAATAGCQLAVACNLDSLGEDPRKMSESEPPVDISVAMYQRAQDGYGFDIKDNQRIVSAGRCKSNELCDFWNVIQSKTSCFPS